MYKKDTKIFDLLIFNGYSGLKKFGYLKKRKMAVKIYQTV